MKIFDRQYQVALILGLTLVLSGCSSRVVQTKQAVTVVRIKGEARYFVDGHPWRPLKKGDVFKPGITIQTATNSFVDIGFDQRLPRSVTTSRDSTVSADPERSQSLRILENSTIMIEKAVKENHWSLTHWRDERADEENLVTLSAGSIMGRTGLASSNSIYQFSFINGVATLSANTAFRLDAVGSIKVVGGSASLFFPSRNATLEVPSRQQYDSSSGTATAMSADEIKALSNLIPSVPPYEVVTMPDIRRQGMGGSLRKF